MSESDLNDRIETLVQWISQAQHLVVFTGAGISTESGLPDFRGPDGLWTRRDKGLPPPQFDWSSAKPNQSHIAIAQLQDMGKLAFLISQNIDNLHLESGINPDSLAELHGNLTKLRCRKCGYKCDSFPDLKTCPLCKGELRTSVVNSLVVYPAADMPRIAFQSGSKLVIINRGETPLDGVCHLRFQEAVGEVLVPVVARLQEIMDS